MFSDISALWLSSVAATVKESTYTRYSRAVSKYLIPYFGSQELQRIDENIVTAFVYGLSTRDGSPLSSKTITDIMSVFKRIWTFGSQNGYPCSDIQNVVIPKVKTKAVSVIPQSAVKVIEAELQSKNDITAMCVVLTLFTGLRNGEICGLRWGDVDLENKMLHIRRTVERIADLSPDAKNKTKVIISKPKTESSFRDIPLPDFLVRYLRQYRQNDECYLLTGSSKFIEPARCYSRYKSYLKRKGLGDYTFHALRHTFATRCVESGFDAKSLSEILGHANVRTTLSVYVHPTMEMKRQQMELLAPKH